MRRVAVLAVALISVAGLAGCSAYNASHDFNAPTPVRIIPGNWARIETPGNFPSAVFECIGSDGIYQTMDNSSSIEVEPNDPNCTGNPVLEGRP